MRAGGIGSLLLAICAGGCSSTEPRVAVDIGPDTTSRRLSVGSSSSCAVTTDGKTHCWGANMSREFGANSLLAPPYGGIPVLAPVAELTSLNRGASYTLCGVTPARAIICWGRGGWGQLARGFVEDVGGNPPAEINLKATWAGVNIGRLTTCAWTTDGSGYCWGADQAGETGDPALWPAGTVRGNNVLTRVTTPHLVAGGIKFSSIAPGWQHTCGISTTGAAYCWGWNANGQLGLGTKDSLPHPTPAIVSTTVKFRMLSLGMQSTCGITTESAIYCWGYNQTGQLGDGTTFDRPLPTPIASSKKFIDVSVGTDPNSFRDSIVRPAAVQGGIASVCALAEDKTAWCWGWNGGGQLGDGTVVTHTSPAAVSGGMKFTSIAAGGGFACAAGATAIWCWGANAFGQLGNTTGRDSHIPVSVTSLNWP